MKKFLYLIVCLMAMVVSVSSCSKDDDDILPYENEKSLSYDKSILLGTWKVSEVKGYYTEHYHDRNSDESYIFYPDITDVKHWAIVFSPTYIYLNLDYWDAYKHKFDYGIKDWKYTNGLISGIYTEYCNKDNEWETFDYSGTPDTMELGTIKIVSKNKIIIHASSEELGEEYDECDCYMTFVKVNNNYDINPNVSYDY